MSTPAITYGGFWARFAAKFVDGLIVGTLQIVVHIFLFIALAGQLFGFFSARIIIADCIVSIVYSTVFIGTFGATPGKMLCGLKTVRADGEKVSYLRALGRYSSEILSTIVFMVGYIMAAFDEEKRTLHDRICDTRVILCKWRLIGRTGEVAVEKCSTLGRVP